jgi:hypothetical protein
MVITNQTTQDYWFGPLHLPAGVGTGTLTVDDTSATSLYLSDDSVADAINYLYAQVPAKITVTNQALPFPRPTGKPDLLHGDGSPEGLVYASEGTLYLRRDRAGIYQKTSMVHLNTGWNLIGDLDPLRPSAAIAESIPRASADDGVAASLVTAQLTFVAIYLQQGVPVNSITAVSGATAVGTPVNQWFCLYDLNLNKLAVTADDTTTAWAANAAKTLAISPSFTPTYTGLHYIGIMVKATTVPTLSGSATRIGVTGLTPKTAGTSTSGLTNPASAPATAAALTAIAATPYIYTS